MTKPDMIILVITFQDTHKSKLQVAAKDFILGKPAENKLGELERLVNEEVGNKVRQPRVISCYKFSLIKFPVSEGPDYSRARGAIGMFRFLGSEDELDTTLRAIRKVCEDVKGKNYRNWDSFEIYTAKRWSD